MNKVILSGRITKDIELKQTSNNIANCSFTIAVDRKFKKDGESQADFINCVAWRNTAEFMSKYFSKGRKIMVSGSIQTRTWDDKDGKKHYVTEIMVDEVDFADSNNSSSGSGKSAAKDDADGFMPVDDPDDLPF